MKKMNVKTFQRRYTWEKVEQVLTIMGWKLSEREKDRIIFRRGNQMIISFKTIGGKWKTEYFVGKKLLDSTGVNDAEFTQLLTMELGFSK